MKKVFVFVFAIVLFAQVVCLAVEGFSIAVHAHVSFADDGWDSPRKVIQYYRMLSYDGIIFTPHNDSLMEQGDFYSYQRVIESLCEKGFVVIGGMEISVVKSDRKTGKPLPTLCHIGNFGITASNPYIYNSGWDWNSLWYVLIELRGQRSISICNHVKDCKPWAPWAGDFDGFELFNDFSTKAQYRENYIFQRDAYLNILKTRQRLFVVAGIDLHLLVQSFFGRITTFVFSETLSKEGIIDAIRNGKTVAASNIEKISLNISPSLETNFVSEGKFKIEGAIKTVKGHIPPKEVIIYKNGVNYGTILLKSKEIAHALSNTFFFSFEDNASESASCYTLEIEEFMITSPFCFQKNSGYHPLPGKAFRITKVRTDQMFFTTDKEGLEHPYTYGSAFEYCYDNFMLTTNGLVFGCKNPLMIKGVSDNEDGSVLYYAKGVDIEKVERSFAVKLGENEYKCVIDQVQGQLIISARKNVKPGDKFYVCDPNEPISYNEEDESISCKETCLGEASPSGTVAFRAFQRISGDCPVMNLGSVWLVPAED